MRDPNSLAPRDIELTAELLSSLDSALRLQILLLLHSGDHVVHEMVDALGKSQPLISQHLRVLKGAGLVRAQRVGREVTYSLAQPAIIDVILELATLAADGELDRRRAARAAEATGGSSPAAASGAAIIKPPADVRPDIDPGLAPRTPRPRRD